MTGLDANADEIMQIACYVTDYDLNLMDDEGVEIVVRLSKERLDQMDEWCTQHHGSSGLTQACIDSKVSPEYAADAILKYIKTFVPQSRRALLAGSSVHADRAFLVKPPYKAIVDHLHYRILDVSSIKEAARRWAPADVLKELPRKKNLHTARADILESIAEARFYRNAFFTKAS
jgi:oligoribonuclease